MCVQLIQQSARDVGHVLAGLVNFFNPSLVVIGGGVSRSSDDYIAAIRETVYGRSLPLATRDLAPAFGALFVMPSDRDVDLAQYPGLRPFVTQVGHLRLHAWRAYAKTSPSLRIQLTMKELVIA